VYVECTKIFDYQECKIWVEPIPEHKESLKRFPIFGEVAIVAAHLDPNENQYLCVFINLIAFSDNQQLRSDFINAWEKKGISINLDKDKVFPLYDPENPGKILKQPFIGTYADAMKIKTFNKFKSGGICNIPSISSIPSLRGVYTERIEEERNLEYGAPLSPSDELLEVLEKNVDTQHIINEIICDGEDEAWRINSAERIYERTYLQLSPDFIVSSYRDKLFIDPRYIAYLPTNIEHEYADWKEQEYIADIYKKHETHVTWAHYESPCDNGESPAFPENPFPGPQGRIERSIVENESFNEIGVLFFWDINMRYPEFHTFSNLKIDRKNSYKTIIENDPTSFYMSASEEYEIAFTGMNEKICDQKNFEFLLGETTDHNEDLEVRGSYYATFRRNWFGDTQTWDYCIEDGFYFIPFTDRIARSNNMSVENIMFFLQIHFRIGGPFQDEMEDKFNVNKKFYETIGYNDLLDLFQTDHKTVQESFKGPAFMDNRGGFHLWDFCFKEK
jgi:hypothetical protein